MPDIPRLSAPSVSCRLGSVHLVETIADAESFKPRDPDNLAYVTQTTLSVDDTAEIVAVLKQRFPEHRRAPQGRHLLRHHQPPGGGQAGSPYRRRNDRGRLAQFLELAAAQGSGDAQRLCLRGADAARRRYRLVEVRACQARSASPPARPRRRCLVQEIVDAFARALCTRHRRSSPAPRRKYFSRCRGRCAAARPPNDQVTRGGLHRRRRRGTADISGRLRSRRGALLQGNRRRASKTRIFCCTRPSAISSSRSTRSASRRTTSRSFWG